MALSSVLARPRRSGHVKPWVNTDWTADEVSQMLNRSQIRRSSTMCRLQAHQPQPLVAALARPTTLRMMRWHCIASKISGPLPPTSETSFWKQSCRYHPPTPTRSPLCNEVPGTYRPARENRTSFVPSSFRHLQTQRCSAELTQCLPALSILHA